MSLRVHQQRLFPGERAPDRLLEEPGGERGLPLIGHVLLPTECAAVRNEFDGYGIVGNAEERSDLIAVVPHALATRVHVKRSGCRHGEGRFGFEECVFYPLRGEDFSDNMPARRECCVDVTSVVDGPRQDVAVESPHCVLVGGEGLLSVGEWSKRSVLDGYQLSRLEGRLSVLGNDDRNHITEVRGAAAFGNEHGPVFVYQPDSERSRDVLAREDGNDTVEGFCIDRVDAENVRSGMIGEAEGSMQHPVDSEVVDVAPAAEGQFSRFVFGTRRTDAARSLDLDWHAVRDRFDSVKHLEVAGAPAEVRSEVTPKIVAGEVDSFLVDERFRSHDDARGTEPALSGAIRGERVGKAIPLCIRQPFESRDTGSLGLCDVQLARHAGLPVDEDRARTTLTRR